MFLEKYNVTMTEYYCVCYANCRWRPLTKFEKEMEKEISRRNAFVGYLRKGILGVTYPVIFVLGVTGTICKFIFSNKFIDKNYLCLRHLR